ncbi:CCA tRNA nucleotidyltransferase [Viridibacillus sp. YIM B01967]|uniref:CCA-adding enzyme n=1 Tax=Viridibacillus soli TaxID=2798301 RepID=A0ABS1HBF4_9BACL|nr:CCA tRNA nucleotidyltransferase [Viridibacillus soli]MBK3496744.1 CCA tRNA nucleotidyltransferase [Viridibacillus soli]
MKLDVNWQAAFNIIHSLEKAGYEAVIVGGAVRDYLRGHLANDVDIATSALPEEVKTVFSRTADVGIAHGTVLVIHPLSPVEVTTYRTEGSYADHRRPDDVQFVRSLEEDLKRRDFTINAMAMRASKEIVDLYGGQSDLKAQLIRAVGNASDRFAEDALRMLRAIRFSAQLGFAIEEETFKAIRKQAADLSYIAKERIKAEFDKIWTSANAKEAIYYVNDTQLVDYLPVEFSGNANAWSNFESRGNPMNGWAFLILLQRDENALQLLKAFNCSNKEKVYVQQVLQAYKRRITPGWTARDYFEFDLPVLEIANDFAEKLNRNIGNLNSSEIPHKKKLLTIQSRTEIAVNGRDLMEWSGKKSGPWLKVVIDKMVDEILSNKLVNERQHIKEWFSHESNIEK